MKSEHQLVHVFCDFDGTITRKDSGDEFFRQFSSFEPYHSDLMSGLCSVTAYYDSVVRFLTNTLNEETIQTFADSCETDMYFQQFVSLMTDKKWNMHIVSDGFDIYINPILHRILPNTVLDSYCNQLIPPHSQSNQHEYWLPLYRYADESCKCFCASCKRNIMLSVVHPDDMIIYIGDGLSDTCPVIYADMVFAKGPLAAYCNKNGIMHHQWHTFFDIISVLNKRNPARRDSARKNRQKAFEQE